MVFVVVPMLVSPEKVVIVKVMLTVVPVVFSVANDKGGVHVMDVTLDFVAAFPDVLPHLYVMVCVSEESCLVTVKV